MTSSVSRFFAHGGTLVRTLLGMAFFVALVASVSWLAGLYDLPLPAPIMAMAFLVLGLAAQRRVPRTLEHGAHALFRLFPLLFIPPLVAIVQVLPLVLANMLVLLIAVSASTLAGLLVTAGLYRLMVRRAS